ncbi:MAG: Tail Collar domain protein, partial [Verrucomicrobiales bacterium]|nr:Tail Collar domain protein [Verrucomicrobiales bacterium]
MSSPLLAEIKMFGGNFAPRGYAFCDGSILSIAQNTALFSLLGTTYGGNGQTTFALPDLRGRVPVHAGASTGPGLSPVVLGESAGTESITLLVNNMPAHTHTNNISVALPCNTGAGSL